MPADQAMTPPEPPGSSDGVRWSDVAVLVVDLAESVRLMAADEVGTIDRWRRFVAVARARLAGTDGARLVKSLGDGLLMTFRSVHEAIATAQTLFREIAAQNVGTTDALRLQLRMGIHQALAVVDDLDIYGAGVNLCARIAGLARPGDLLISAAARDKMVLGLDGDVEDLGPCFLKHLDGTYRVFRVLPSSPQWRAVRPDPTLRPRLGVLPWRVTGAPATGASGPAVARAMSDDLIAALAKSAQWVVSSRLTSAALADRALRRQDAALLLGVDYTLDGHIDFASGLVDLQVELCEVGRGSVIWSGRYRVPLDGLLTDDSAFVRALVADVSVALLSRQVHVAHQAALPTLAGYTLMLDAVTKMFACDGATTPTARPMLEHLIDRHPRSAEAKAWLAQWHFLQLAQQNTRDRHDDVQRAHALLARALDDAPEHALSLALSGHLQAYVDGASEAAEARLRQAMAQGPNEPLAALFLSQVLRNRGKAAEAVQAIEHASALSPLDPLGYYFDLFAASAYSAAGDHELALTLALRSLRHNGLHLSTWVQVIIEQVHVHHMEDARTSAARYLALRPNASVDRYLERHPARDLPLAVSDAQALLEAGLPR